jgi:U2 small nuclear ribonucleoprotein A'
MRTFLPLG